MPAPIKPTLLRRLPPDYRPPLHQRHPPRRISVAWPRELSRLWSRSEPATRLYPATKAACSPAPWAPPSTHSSRTSPASAKPTTGQPARAALKQLQPRIAAQIRAIRHRSRQGRRHRRRALQLALDASNDPTGQWILSPHPEDASEARWTGIVAGACAPCRSTASSAPASSPSLQATKPGGSSTTKPPTPTVPTPPPPCPSCAQLFAPQLEAYAQVLRNLHGTDAPIRAGLYYPRMILFDWWEI